MEKKEIKISLETLICIFIIVVLLAVIGIMYLKMKNMDSKDTVIKQEEIKEQEKEEKTNIDKKEENETNETNLMPIFEISKAYVKDGYFYYSINGEDAKRYEELSNVTKVRVFNIGTGINKVPFLITEDGKAYEVKKDLSGNIKAVIYKPLKNYKVEDILDKTGERQNH